MTIDRATAEFLDRVAADILEAGAAPTEENIAAAMKARLERDRALLENPAFVQGVLRAVYESARS